MKQRTINLHGQPVVAAENLNASQAVCVVGWLKLIRDRRWSSQQKLRLLQHFVDPEQIYSATELELCRALPQPWQGDEAGFNHGQLEQDLNWLSETNNHLLCFGEQAYPNLLTTLPDPPIALFATGDVGCLLDPQVALVGSRRPTPVGKKITATIGGELARLGIVLTSGMALGIDGCAHQAALSAGSKTVAVMGCGLDIVYPPRHRTLFEQIINNGCALSEYPLGYPVSKYTFPKRNRLVSGLSLGVIIIEAAQRSGTLITARLAMEQNRSVMVVPGAVMNPQYHGSHQLLQQGAALVTSADDVLSELNLPLRAALQGQAKSSKNSAKSDSEQKVLNAIFYDSTAIDTIISASGLTAAEVSSMLLALELDGEIALADDGGYVRIS